MTTHHLVYVDESGEPGTSYALGAVFLRHDQWLTTHDQIVGYRRHLAREHRFLTRHELKAYELLGNGGPWRDLQVPARTRHGIYRSALRVLRQAAPAARAIGVVAPDRDDVDHKGAPEEATWRTLLERIEAFCRHNDSTVMLLVDQGSWSRLTRLTREFRRIDYVPSAFTPGASLARPLHQLIDDPVWINSARSWEMQWADLVAHAAWRSVLPDRSQPHNWWHDLGGARLAEANEIERRYRGSAEQEGLLVIPSRLRTATP